MNTLKDGDHGLVQVISTTAFPDMSSNAFLASLYADSNIASSASLRSNIRSKPRNIL